MPRSEKWTQVNIETKSMDRVYWVNPLFDNGGNGKMPPFARHNKASVVVTRFGGTTNTGTVKDTHKGRIISFGNGYKQIKIRGHWYSFSGDVHAHNFLCDISLEFINNEWQITQPPYGVADWLPDGTIRIKDNETTS